jgi:hypothetical protein
MNDEESGNMEISFRCDDCGKTDILLPDDYTDDSIATCATCHKPLGRFEDIKAEAIEAAGADLVDDLDRSFRDGFRGIKGITIK